MLPSATDFSAAMGLLGVKKTDTVVVYDSKELGLFSAPRVAWMLRAFGHEKVHILDNYREWCAHGLPTESGEAGEGNAVEYGEAKTPENVVGYEDMVAGAKNEFQKTVVLDARPAGRFKGMDPEPRPGLSSGHMPGSLSVPFSAVLDAETKTLLPRKKLREVFEKAGVREGMPIVSSCGTGVTAAVVDLALEEAGYKGERKIYDGSWSEYAARVGEGEGLIVKD
jgi:thiosulfate/3-mercaptopyruvate sulfurtransferase